MMEAMASARLPRPVLRPAPASSAASCDALGCAVQVATTIDSVTNVMGASYEASSVSCQFPLLELTAREVGRRDNLAVVFAWAVRDQDDIGPVGAG